MRRTARTVFTLASCFLVLSSALPARAQSVIEREGERDRTIKPKRGHGENWIINYRDCVDENDFEFTLNFDAAAEGLSLDVYAGLDSCEDRQDRRGDTAVCWQVAERTTVVDTKLHLIVKVRDIVAGLIDENIRGPLATAEGSEQPVDDAAGGAPGSEPVTGGGAAGAAGAAGASESAEAESGHVAACDFQGSDAPQPFTISFLLVNQTGEVQGQSAFMTDNFDLLGPTPPTDITVQPIEQGLKLSWTRSDSTDQAGYRFYCAEATEPEGAAGAGDGASCEAAGADNDFPGPERNPGPDFECGSLTGQLVVDGSVKTLGERYDGARMENDVLYAVRVAGVDDYDNIGDFSSIACGIPKAVSEFFEVYRQNGGKGGGGFCALRRGYAPNSTQGLVLLLCSAAAWLARRSRRRSPRRR